MNMVSLILLFTFLGVGVAQLDNLKLYKVNIENKEELAQLGTLSDSLPVHFLNDLGRVPNNYHVVVDPENQEMLEKVLTYNNLNYESVSDNLQELVHPDVPTIAKPDLEWTQYHDLDVINKWLFKSVLQHPRYLQPYLVGFSWEKRPIFGLKLSRKKGNKAIFIEANIHAIEVISSAAGTCFFDALLNSKDPKIRQLSKNNDWIFVPVANPDGFVQGRLGKLWRKNRQPTGFYNASGPCYGTDLNRNFDYMWNVTGYNKNVPCDHWYAGRAPASEVEVKWLQRFVSSFPDDYIRVFLAFHSYGNFLLLPYGHTTEIFPDNYDQMMRISKGFADAAIVKYNTTFKYGASGLLNYAVSGSAKDWAYGVKHIPYTATVELRDTGKYGFFLPANQIIEVCEELTDGLVGLVEAANKEQLFD